MAAFPCGPDSIPEREVYSPAYIHNKNYNRNSKKEEFDDIYIGTMDIEKAFDHVPRSLMLRKLVGLGIGKCMLFALKQLYRLYAIGYMRTKASGRTVE